MGVGIGQQLGSYTLAELLGRGGMGEVYRARDTRLKRDVAIKILPEEFSRDPHRLNRFQREAEVLASLNHPNIAAIYDVAEAGGTRFLVLELVEGETLAERIERGRIPVEEVLQIATRAKRFCATGFHSGWNSGLYHWIQYPRRTVAPVFGCFRQDAGSSRHASLVFESPLVT